MSSFKNTIAIIGGGFAGAITAIRLMQTSTLPLRIIIIGDAVALGRGIAYSTTNRNHLVNGLASTFGIIPEQPLHLVDWLRENAASQGWIPPEGVPFEEAFPPRWLYGSYVQDTLEQALDQNRDRVTFEHVRSRATGLRRAGGGFQIQTDQGRIQADSIVLATGLQPRIGLEIEGDTQSGGDKVINTLWDPNAWQEVAKDERLLIVGSGLTALDCIISAEHAGFQGEYLLLSRRGVLVQTRYNVAPWPDVLDGQALPSTLAELVHHARTAREDIRRDGGHRQQLAGAIRPHVPAMWLCASVRDKLRYIRHLRPFWENILHRAAPESGKRLDAIIASGRLKRHAGRLLKLALLASGEVQVTWRARASATEQEIIVDRVIDAHGYEFDWSRVDDPLVRDLLSNGLVRPHATGFGIEANGVTGQIEVEGVATAGFYAVGHPLRGASWESNSIGEQVIQAVAAAKGIFAEWELRQTPSLEAAL